MIQDGDGNSYCERCSTNEGRYFYLIQVSIDLKIEQLFHTIILGDLFKAELSDFSASKWVLFFDDAAEKLIGDPADELAKLMRYQPDSLRARESKWTVYDLKEIDFAEFIPYLRDLVEKKGYKFK
uniref:Rep_fac-A_C domain-containing protein n=1 Tax=Heterorhabditis bacteriophora TaxID=37862 RepID=A0A1I7X6I3_HETBA